MFEYQTTGTHIVSYSALEVLLVNAREGAVEGRGHDGELGGAHSSVGGGLVFAAAAVVLAAARQLRVV